MKTRNPQNPSTRKAEAGSQIRPQERLATYIAVCNPRFVFSATGFQAYACRWLERNEMAGKRRLILTVSPQHGKSTLVAEEYASWFIGRYPDRHAIIASYAAARSIRHGRAVRERLRQPEFQALFPNCRLWEGASTSAHEWLTTQGGGCLSVGVGGSLTGATADLLIIDDPVANAEEANSPAMREKTWDWFLSTAMTRLSEQAVVVIIMTRWHLDDLVGRLIDPRPELETAMAELPGGWRRVNIPALAEDNDLLGRKPGEALFPELKSSEFIRQQMARLTRYWAQALYAGRPVPRGGHLLDANTLRIVQPDDPRLIGLRWVRAWDPAAVSKETSKRGDPDFTAGARCALDSEGNFWIFDIAKWQLGWPKSRDRIRLIAESERIPVYFEAQSAFQAAADNLREVMPRHITVRTVTTSKDKVSRCNDWFALAEHGKVFVVAGSWVAGFLDAVEQFDGCGSYHDDEIDAVSIAYEACRLGVGFECSRIRNPSQDNEGLFHLRTLAMLGV